MKSSIGIVPNRKLQGVIDDHSANEFQLGDQNGREQGFGDDFSGAQTYVDEINGAKTNSAQNAHGKMGVSPGNQLDDRV